MKKYDLIILDRDGVINEDSDQYIKSPQEWQAIPGSLGAIARLNQAGYLVCVCSNQSGLGRALFDEEALTAIHRKMVFALQDEKGWFDWTFYCPHTPEDQCDCRKPKPGLYQQALQHFNVTAECTLVIGDSLRDLEAAQAIGADTFLVLTGKGQKTLETLGQANPYPVFNDLNDAVKSLL